MIKKEIKSGTILKLNGTSWPNEHKRAKKEPSIKPYISIGITSVPGEYKTYFVDVGLTLFDLLLILDRNTFIDEDIMIVNQKPIVVFVNDSLAKEDTKLNDGDHVLIDFRKK